MDLSELIFVYLGPLLYNIIFLSLWGLWFIYHSDKEDQRVKFFFRKYLENNTWFYMITGIVILIFFYLLFSYAIDNTDVDNAITSGVEAFLNGHNPYKEDVVEHHLNGEITYGRYHYFPPDLISYTLFYLFGGSFFVPFFNTYWFVPFHFLLLIPGYWIVAKIVPWPRHKVLPFFVLLITPFLFTNSILMWFLFLLGYYYYEIKNYHIRGMTFYVLAASVKYMVGFIIVFYFIKDLKKLFNEHIPRNTVIKHIFLQFRGYITAAIVLILFSLPFGLLDVIISVFVYQGAISFREEVAQSGGPLLIELLKLLNLQEIFLLAAGGILIIAILVLWKKPTYNQIIHISFLAMLILPFYATELFITVPFYWWFKEGYKSLLKDSLEKQKE